MFDSDQQAELYADVKAPTAAELAAQPPASWAIVGWEPVGQPEVTAEKRASDLFASLVSPPTTWVSRHIPDAPNPPNPRVLDVWESYHGRRWWDGTEWNDDFTNYSRSPSMTDQPETNMSKDDPEYGDRPEVETSDTQVVQGADGPPADKPTPEEAELASWAGVTPGESEPPTFDQLGLDQSDLELAREAGRILSLTEDPQVGEEEAHAYAEDPSSWLRRSSGPAATDPRPAALADDPSVEVQPSGEFSGFTEGFTAGQITAHTPPEPEDCLSFDFYRADGSRISVSRGWRPGSAEALAEVRRVALLMEEAVEGGV